MIGFKNAKELNQFRDYLQESEIFNFVNKMNGPPPKKDTVVLCPYDSNHGSMKINRLIYHLIKCSVYLEKPNSLAICRYNFTHRIPHDKIVEHE